MFESLSAILIAIAVIAVVGCYLLYRRTRAQNQLLQDMQNQYLNLSQDIRKGGQQQVMNTAEALSDTRRRALASLFENVDMQLNNLMTSIMRHVMSESAHAVSVFANSIDGGNSNASSTGSGGSGGGGGSGSSGGGIRNPLPPASPSPVQQRTASAQSTRPPAAVHDLFKSATDNNPPLSGTEDTEVYIKAIEAISQLYHKRTQQATEKHRHIAS